MDNNQEKGKDEKPWWTKNIYELEQDVKDLMYKDKSDPMMYIYFKRLIEKILVVKYLAFNAREADEISHEVAADIYMELNDPKKKDYFYIYAPTKYIFRLIKGRISKYLWEYVDKPTYDVSDPLVKEEFINNNFPEVSKVGYKDSLKDTVQDIPYIIQKTYDKYIRYYKDSKKYKSTKISLYLSIYYNEIFIYNEYTDRLLLEFLYKIIIRNINEMILNNISDDQEYYNLDSIKIYEMSVSGGDD